MKKIKNGKIEVRLYLDRNIWAEVKAKATRENKKVAEAAAELIALGLSLEVKGAER